MRSRDVCLTLGPSCAPSTSQACCQPPRHSRTRCTWWPRTTCPPTATGRWPAAPRPPHPERRARPWRRRPAPSRHRRALPQLSPTCRPSPTRPWPCPRPAPVQVGVPLAEGASVPVETHCNALRPTGMSDAYWCFDAVQSGISRRVLLAGMQVAPGGPSWRPSCCPPGTPSRSTQPAPTSRQSAAPCECRVA